MKVWLEDANGNVTGEPYELNNEGLIRFYGLAAKRGKAFSMNASLLENDNSYSVDVIAQNNSLQSVSMGKLGVRIKDQDGNVIAENALVDTLELTGEQEKLLPTVNISKSVLAGTPVSVDVFEVSQGSSAFTVTFSVSEENGESCATKQLMTGEEGKLTTLPTASKDNYTFDGWYTAETGGELITESSVFAAGTTVYARFSPNIGIGTGAR